MSSTIPLEIEELIVDFLAEDDTNHLAIKTCSLVCRTFLPLCRKHIFASIVLNGSQSTTTHKFEQLLSKSPEIADYIRELDYDILVDDFTSISSQECLKRISRLRSLSLRDSDDLDWSSNHLRPVLLHLLHLPTLTHFSMFAINNFVASDLIPCGNLKKLDIGHHTNVVAGNIFSGTVPDRPIQLNEFVVGFRNTAIRDICTAQRPDGQPVIDFGRLAKITVVIPQNVDIEALHGLFGRCKQLTNVNISHVVWNQCFCPGLSKMLQPSMQTLTHLNVNTRIYHPDLDLPAGIHSELEDIRNKNIIENIVITVMVQMDEKFGRGDSWGRLDEVLTRSGWPALRQVLLTINTYTLSGSRSDDELQVALRKLPKTRFPRLSVSKSVSFDLFLNLRR